MYTMDELEDFCDGCCYRRDCNQGLEKCCYLQSRDGGCLVTGENKCQGKIY